MTATAACFGLRPVGERVRDVARDDRDPRLRQVGHRAEPLDHRVQLGRLARGVTIFAPDAASASLSDVQYCTAAIATMITSIGASPTFR